MITEEEYFKKFEENCYEQLKSFNQCKAAIYNLEGSNCPFPTVCGDVMDECSNNMMACPGSRRPEDCLVSVDWFHQVEFFWPNKRNVALTNKMIRIIQKVRMEKFPLEEDDNATDH